MTFSKLGLTAPILQAVAEQGYVTPTEIQQQAIPAILAGSDVVAGAQTGTGKTASFVLPILQLYSGDHKRRAKRLRALILVPTRELAMQVEDNIKRYGRHLNVSSMVMVGGVDLAPQKQSLIDGVDIVVATPGRLLDLAQQRAVHFDELKVLVLDEADRMLDMGFIDDINRIIDRLPMQLQNLLFSATLSEGVRRLATTVVDQPVELSIESDSSATPQISQWVVAIDKHNKSSLLGHLINQQRLQQALIFIRTQHGAAKLVSQLEKRGIKAESIHGGRSQAARTQILADFKSGEISFLVATGVAARGIDINQLACVVNYDLPDDADDYIHRIGRTGRAGASGEAVSLVSKDDFKRLCAIERRLGEIIERKIIDGFTVVKDLPASSLNFMIKSGGSAQSPGAQNKQAKGRTPKPKTSSGNNHNDADTQPDPWKKNSK